MRIVFLYIGVFLLSTLSAKEIFTKDHIRSYLNIDNPFVYSAIGEKYIYKEKENYQLGNFDTKLSAEYDKKDYPLSEAEFFRTGISKPIDNGMEFSLNYRRAEGTQEYNNIKTGDDGEVLLGVKIPVVSVLNNTNKRKLNLESSRLDTSKINYKSQDNLRILYFDIVSSYYKLLYYKQNKLLISDLLNNAKQRVSIIKKRVDVGSLAKLSFLEAKQQIINRKQRVLTAKNQYENALQVFLQYLNISDIDFNKNYTLPSIEDIQENYVKEDISIDNILQNRPDLKVYANEIKKLDLQNKFTSASKYPSFDVGLYGVHDFKYENGFKVTLGMDFPIERRKYTSKSLEIQNSIKNIDKLKERKILIIKTNLQVIDSSINTLINNIKNSKIEVDLVQRLEVAENKKYKVGLSDLFMVNQREIYTLQIKKKLLKYNLDYLLLQQELEKIIAKPLEISKNQE